MEKRDFFLILFVTILLTSFIYIYQNVESLDCYVDYTFGDMMGNIEYAFEPNGSLYGKTRIYRFSITSYSSRLEYYGMEILKDGEVVSLENMTNPEGGSISAAIQIDEDSVIEVNRFFKKKCYPEISL